MHLQPLKTNDVFLYIPSHFRQPSSSPITKPIRLLFFITGNPGLLSYYHEFFGLLCVPPAETSTSVKFSTQDCFIAGFSLGGFEDRPVSDSDELTESLLFPPGFVRKPVDQTYTLRDQIDLAHARLQNVISLIQDSLAEYDGNLGRVEVILQGHSVGAYVALSMLELIHAKQIQSENESGFVVRATHLLAPTITRLATSDSGRVTTRLLGWVPILPSLAQGGASVLSGCLPGALMKAIVGGVTGMKSGSTGLETTARFLGGANGVRQALDLARWELEEIGEEKWDADVIWGKDGGGSADGVCKGKAAGWKAPEHFLLYAKKDHWVADETRQEIVAARQGRARIVVDDTGELVHAWCLWQSGLVARWVREWTDELFNQE